jgi:hypothetical protein
MVTLEMVQHTGPPYNFGSCTLFHDVDPFHCQQNEETLTEQVKKYECFQNVPLGKIALAIQILVKAL